MHTESSSPEQTKVAASGKLSTASKPEQSLEAGQAAATFLHVEILKPSQGLRIWHRIRHDFGTSTACMHRIEGLFQQDRDAPGQSILEVEAVPSALAWESATSRETTCSSGTSNYT